MFEYINRKRDPVAVAFYCGLVPFGLFWIMRQSLIAGFALQAYLLTVIVFVFYPFEMQAHNIKQRWFWKRMLVVGAVVHVLVLAGLWSLDANFQIFVTGTGTVFFVGFVAGVIEMIAVGEMVDRSRPEGSVPGRFQ
jgi:hypothetical protein